MKENALILIFIILGMLINSEPQHSTSKPIHVTTPNVWYAQAGANRDATSTNPFLLAFGVSGEFGMIFYLPWIITTLTLVSVFATIQSWRERWWKSGHRIHYGFVTVACVVFVASAGWLGFL